MKINNLFKSYGRSIKIYIKQSSSDMTAIPCRLSIQFYFLENHE